MSRGFVGITVVVMAVILGFIWWRLPGKQSEEPVIEFEISGTGAGTPVSNNDLVRQSQNWAPPLGAYDLTVALDRSGSITDKDRDIGRAVVDSVANRVQGANRLHLVEFANAYETFGQAEGPDGIKELLNRWRNSTQYSQDREHTNITLTLHNLLQRVMPIIKQGYLAEIIIVTDGDNDPPPGQASDADYLGSIEEALGQIDIKHENRLRMHVIEVGKQIKYAGKVANVFLRGKATTIKAGNWSEVAEIVTKLQSELQGSFALQSPYKDELKIKVPDDRPSTLGPFTLNLSGVDQSNFNLILEPADPTIGDRLEGFVSVNSGKMIPFTVGIKEVRDRDLLLFEFRSSKGIEKEYFSSQLWRGKDWGFSVVVEPKDNILPLQDVGTRLQIKMHRDSLVFEDGLRAFFWIVGVGGGLLILIIYLLCRSTSSEDSDEEEEKDEEEVIGAEFAQYLAGVIQYAGKSVAFSGREQEVNEHLRFSCESDGVHLMPFVTVIVTIGSKPAEILYADSSCLLPTNIEVKIREMKTSLDYTVMLANHTTEEM